MTRWLLTLDGSGLAASPVWRVPEVACLGCQLSRAAGSMHPTHIQKRVSPALPVMLDLPYLLSQCRCVIK